MEVQYGISGSLGFVEIHDGMLKNPLCVAVIIRILAIIDQAMRVGQLISKRSVLGSCTSNDAQSFELMLMSDSRDIYYIDPAYFRSQTTVDTVIDDLAYTIGVDRAALNVVSPCHIPQRALNNGDGVC